MNILILEDEYPDLFVDPIKAHKKWSVVGAKTYKEADMLAHETVFNVVIADICLNGEDSGLDFLKHYKRENPECITIAATGKEQYHGRLLEVESQAWCDKVFYKPLDFGKVIEYIEGCHYDVGEVVEDHKCAMGAEFTFFRCSIENLKERNTQQDKDFGDLKNDFSDLKKGVAKKVEEIKVDNLEFQKNHQEAANKIYQKYVLSTLGAIGVVSLIVATIISLINGPMENRINYTLQKIDQLTNKMIERSVPAR